MQSKWTPQIVAFGLCFLPLPISAQWIVASVPLEAGPNANWLPHNTDHGTMDYLLAGQVATEEVSRWNPASWTTFPSMPEPADTRWLDWKRRSQIDTVMTMFGRDTVSKAKVADRICTRN